MILFKMIVLMYKEISDKIQNKDVVKSFIMLLRLGYQIVLRDQCNLMKTVDHQKECGELLEIVKQRICVEIVVLYLVSAQS